MLTAPEVVAYKKMFQNKELEVLWYCQHSKFSPRG